MVRKRGSVCQPDDNISRIINNNNNNHNSKYLYSPKTKKYSLNIQSVICELKLKGRCKIGSALPLQKRLAKTGDHLLDIVYDDGYSRHCKRSTCMMAKNTAGTT